MAVAFDVRIPETFLLAGDYLSFDDVPVSVLHDRDGLAIGFSFEKWIERCHVIIKVGFLHTDAVVLGNGEYGSKMGGVRDVLEACAIIVDDFRVLLGIFCEIGCKFSVAVVWDGTRFRAGVDVPKVGKLFIIDGVLKMRPLSSVHSFELALADPDAISNIRKALLFRLTG